MLKSEEANAAEQFVKTEINKSRIPPLRCDTVNQSECRPYAHSANEAVQHPHASN